MSVSSVNPYLSALSAYLTNAISGTNATTNATQTSTSSSAVQGASSLDSFELSAPQISFSGYDKSGNSTGGSTTQADIKNFLDKVKSGTVTQSDIQSLQSELQQATPQSNSAQGTTNSTLGSDLKSFLDKVANGTVTSTDLQNMQTEMQETQKTAGTGSAQGHHHHHHHSGGDSSSSSSSSSSLDSDLSSFLDSVANGTVTDTDLKNMQTELQQVQQQASNS